MLKISQLNKNSAIIFLGNIYGEHLHDSYGGAVFCGGYSTNYTKQSFQYGICNCGDTVWKTKR